MREKHLIFENPEAERVWKLLRRARELAQELPHGDGEQFVEVKLKGDAARVALQVGEVNYVAGAGKVRMYVPGKTVAVLRNMNFTF